ncbi:MAG: hypoxanthine phosphoribosyltransferase [Tepidisphaeraceae bacterium]|jgi:hypoxanthine phosphoribosyltransferase
MRNDVERVLISRDAIARRVAELAGQITLDHSPPKANGVAEVTIIPIMTGAMIFAADLIRQLPLKMKIGLLAVSSYPGKSVSSQGVNMLSSRLGDVRGRHLLLVDDILDSGATIARVRELLMQQAPASLRTCVLLRKPAAGSARTPVDYVGFDIPNEFVVGCGLDYNDYYRNLPDIVTLRREVFETTAGPASAPAPLESADPRNVNEGVS